MVLNLEKLNKHIPCKHFLLDIFGRDIRLVSEGAFLASIDLDNVFYVSLGRVRCVGLLGASVCSFGGEGFPDR